MRKEDKMQYEFAFCTDKGKQRKNNQDSLLLKRAVWGGEEVLLAVLCDGMGGLTKGELASAAAVRAFSGWFVQDLPGLLGRPEGGQRLFASWERLLRKLNSDIGEYGQRHGILLGTTVTGMLFLGGQYYIVHVGDCRVYEIGERIVQLTKDQTLVQQEVDQGRLTREEARKDAGSHVLLQCVGASPGVRPVFGSGRLRAGVLYLLCCDGFWHAVSPGELLAAWDPERVKSRTDLKRQLKGLVSLNRARGEQDNISVLGVWGRERC